MDRRKFAKNAGTVALTLSTIKYPRPSARKKAKPLKKGSTIGLITPAGPINETKYKRTISNIESLGFKPLHTDNIFQKNGYLAGADHIKIKEIHDMYANRNVDGIWCIRGGYGTTRLLDHLDYNLIHKNPKPLVGYSDITALMSAIHNETDSPCFHGPVASSTLTSYTKEMLAPLFGLYKPHVIRLSEDNVSKAKETTLYKYSVINSGIVKGKLAGGNLSLIASLIGTPYEIKSKNKIVFIEDVGESPYRIDRMLTQLLSANFFKKVRGIIFGICAGCEKDGEDYQSIQEVIADRLSMLNIPIVYGFSFGHIDDQCTFPIGAEVELNTKEKIVTIKSDIY